MSVEEIKQANIDSAIRWIKGNHPEVSEDSPMFIRFMAEMGKFNDGVFGRGSSLLNGRDFGDCWEKANS